MLKKFGSDTIFWFGEILRLEDVRIHTRVVTLAFSALKCKS